MTEKLSVRVEAMNDAGKTLTVYGEGDTVEEAVEDAIINAVEVTGDDSYTMNEWAPA